MHNLQSGNFGISHEAQDHSKYRLKDTTPSHGAVGGFRTGSEAESSITYSTLRMSGPGSKPAVISALTSGLLYLDHPMLAARVSTSRSCHVWTAPGWQGKSALSQLSDAEHPGGLGFDDEFEPARLHDRQVRRFAPLRMLPVLTAFARAPSSLA